MKVETIYLAVNIADRYLNEIAMQGKPAPNLVLLAITSQILAAKANEPIRPSYELTTELLPSKLKAHVTRHDFLSLESTMLTLLKFDLKYNSPLFFLGRYQRIFSFD